MKHRQIAIAIVLALFSCGLTACSDFTESTADAPQEKNVVLSISNEADFVGRADSFEELIAFADVIVEGTVTHYEGSMAYRENCVYSTMQIEPIAVYKGEYNNETLASCGGEINLKQYMEGLTNNHPMKNNRYTADELENGIVEFQWVNNFTPQVGDRILFFGSYGTNENILYHTSDHQGMFFCDDTTVYTTIYDIARTENDWTDPIAEELYDRCNGSYAFPEALYEPETIFLDKTSLIEIIHTSTEIADET